jgi:hypothetical protein
MRIACEDLAGNLEGKYFLGHLDISKNLRPNHKLDHKSLSNMT